MATHGRYAILKKIADGGMAEIFLASQSGAEGFARSVILKRILPAFCSDPQFRNMIVDEAHIAMSLNHGNVVPVLDLGRADGRYFLVMELVDGWDLSTINSRAAKADFPLPLGLGLYIIAEVCRGLFYAHGRRGSDGKPLGIVHRDVSPQNVLISEQGEVKVTDFGIAKALGKRERTRTGIIKGKVDFMSPEQALGAELEASSDIFSLGTLLYLLATGRKPFEGASDFEALLKVQKAQFKPPEAVRPDLDPGVARVVRKAMEERPSQRYRNAEEMMLDLEEVMRASFGSPGQSQLKRWLVDLGKKDKAPTISRLPGLPVEEGVTLGEVGAGTGTEELTLEDTSVVSPFEQTRVSEGGTPVRAAPVPPEHHTPVTVAAPAVRVAARPRPKRRVSRWVSTLVLLMLAGLVGSRLLPLRTRAELLEQGRAMLRRTRPVATAPNPAHRGPHGEATPVRESRPVERELPRRSEEPREARNDRESKDEPRAAAPKAEAPPARRPSEPRVTLTLQSRPTGATVVGPSGSLGRTPLPYTTRVGSTQALTFAKDGYASTTRKVTGDPKRTKVVVELVRRKRVGRRHR